MLYQFTRQNEGAAQVREEAETAKPEAAAHAHACPPQHTPRPPEPASRLPQAGARHRAHCDASHDDQVHLELRVQAQRLPVLGHACGRARLPERVRILGDDLLVEEAEEPRAEAGLGGQQAL